MKWFLSLILFTSIATAEDDTAFLIIGGGGSPAHNQVSLEKNVAFLNRVQDALGVSTNRNHILFADGQADGRDLQLYDPRKPVPEFNTWMAHLFGSTKGLGFEYRNHEVVGTHNASKPENIAAYLDDQDFTNTERLFVYFTGHGGKGESSKPYNTSMYMWGGKPHRLNAFCESLEKVPEDLPVVMLMVQCYSGGFSHVIFKEGDAKKGLVDHPRCGFFATVHSRIAAGCTPSINEADYQEYSSFFFAALGGKTRVGEPIEDVDYNQDGRVGFDEAHAYALIISESLDVSIKTTDAFLRHFSRYKKEKDDPELVTLDDYDRLLELAGPCEKVVLERLKVRLKLSDDPIKAAQENLKAIEKKRSENNSAKGKLKKEVDALRTTIRNSLKAAYPELSNFWHPESQRLFAEEQDALLKHIKSHEKFEELKKKRSEYSKVSHRHYDYEAEWAWQKRFIHTAENVALEANLERLVSTDILERYYQLKTLEGGSLEDSKAGNSARESLQVL